MVLLVAQGAKGWTDFRRRLAFSTLIVPPLLLHFKHPAKVALVMRSA